MQHGPAKTSHETEDLLLNWFMESVSFFLPKYCAQKVLQCWIFLFLYSTLVPAQAIRIKEAKNRMDRSNVFYTVYRNYIITLSTFYVLQLHGLHKFNFGTRIAVHSSLHICLIWQKTDITIQWQECLLWSDCLVTIRCYFV